MREMTLRVNGEPTAVSARDPEALLVELSYKGNWLVTAVNGELVRREERAGFLLGDGDRIEILAPMQGG